jgi:glutathione peroxidase-family protein
MKTVFSLFAVMTLASAAMAVEVGKPAPDFAAQDINGKTIHLSDYKGKIVVLESYNSDCPYCKNQYQTGAMQAMQRDLAAKGVVWLLVDSVNPNNFSHRTPEQARAEMAAEKMDVTAWIDDSSGAVGHVRHQQGRRTRLRRRD